MKRMRYLVLQSLLVMCTSALAQNDDVHQADSAMSEAVPQFQVYLGASYHLNEFAGTGASFGAIHAGVFFKDKIDVNVYYSAIFDDFHLTVIFPEEYSYNQHNYGVRINYNLLNHNIRPIVGVGYQYSAASWTPEIDSEDIFTDNIHVFSVNVGVGWQIVPAFRIEAKTGYNFARDVELIGLQSDDYDGYKLELSAKLRIFSL